MVVQVWPEYLDSGGTAPTKILKHRRWKRLAQAGKDFEDLKTGRMMPAESDFAATKQVLLVCRLRYRP